MQHTKRVTYTYSHGYPQGIVQSLFEIPMQKGFQQVRFCRKHPSCKICSLLACTNTQLSTEVGKDCAHLSFVCNYLLKLEKIVRIYHLCATIYLSWKNLCLLIICVHSHERSHTVSNALTQVWKVLIRIGRFGVFREFDKFRSRF